MMNRPLLISIICFALVLIIGLVLFFPKYQDFRFVKLQLNTKEKEILDKQEYFSEIDRISEKLKEYPGELAKIDSALPFNPSLPFLFDFFQKISSQNGLILKNISGGYASSSSSSSSSSPSIKEIKISLSLSGSYPAFKNFLTSLEKSARLIEVESISFSFFPETGSAVSFNVIVKTHSY